MRSTLAPAALLLGSTLLLATDASATPSLDILIEGKLAVTKTGKVVKVVSKSDAGFPIPAPGSLEDPTIGGAELQFFDTAAPGAGHVTFTLDASGWQGLGKPAGSKGFKYKGKNDVFDPEPKGTCKTVILKPKVIKAVCAGAAVTLTTPFASTEGISLALPATGSNLTFCAEFGGDEKKNNEKVTTRKNAPAPLSCALPEGDLTGHDPNDVAFLADDALLGRDNDTPGSITAQDYLIAEMEKIGAVGLSPGSGDATFKQAINLGTNIIGMLPGTDLANEYVILGAHYDHISFCTSKNPGDTICNGATDNAAGVAEVLTIARALKHLSPRRSVVLAFWDREEDGLLGSAHYIGNPLVPLASTVAYLNFDIQGNNLSPSIANYSFAIASETGGVTLQGMVDAAVASTSLLTRKFSSIFGQNRSDYIQFVNASVPTVFFSDATGPCYHTNADEFGIVDFAKLERQSRIGIALTIDLATTDTPPAYSPPAATLAVFEDALVLQEILAAGVADIALFGPAEQASILAAKASVDAVVALGPGGFGGGEVGALFVAALDTLAALETIDCDGFF